MQIQTLSVVVPTARCVNSCKYCVSKMHDSPYANQIEKNTRFRDLYEKDYLKRLQFARDNGCNTVILTGNGEALQNKGFLDDFAHWNRMITKPFQWIELQTSGIFLNDEKLRYLRNNVGVTTISVSVGHLFHANQNMEIMGVPEKAQFGLDAICSEIKRYDFNLRLSINLHSVYNEADPERILVEAKKLGADQITFRKLYSSYKNTEQDKWIEEHAFTYESEDRLKRFIEEYGRPLEILPFGAIRYSLDGISIVYDTDCMSEETKEGLKYLILQPNCKLYSHWDDPASLIF